MPNGLAHRTLLYYFFYPIQLKITLPEESCGKSSIGECSYCQEEPVSAEAGVSVNDFR